jgi:hypothetical protein
MPTLQQAAIDTVTTSSRIDIASEQDIKNIVNYAYAVEEKTLLQKIVVHELIEFSKYWDIKGWMGDFPPRMLADLAGALLDHHLAVK